METSEFYLRPIAKGDAEGIYALVGRNSEEFIIYLPKTTASNSSLEASKKFVTNKVNAFKAEKQLVFVIVTKASNTISGLIFIKDFDKETQQAEFAYCIDKKRQGKGWMTKAIHLLTKHAFNVLGLKSLQILVHKTNLGSVKVAKNNGFEWVKTLVNDYTPKGKAPLDMELYVLEAK